MKISHGHGFIEQSGLLKKKTVVAPVRVLRSSQAPLG